MELKKIWFPLVVAALWVVLTAATVSGFIGFSAATRSAAAREAASARRTPGHSSLGRRQLPTAALRADPT